MPAQPAIAGHRTFQGPGGGEGPWWVNENSPSGITLDVTVGEYYILFGNIDSYSGPVLVTVLGSGDPYIRRVLAIDTGAVTFVPDTAEALIMLHKITGTVHVE